ncbi:MAG TPA: MFS transporter [Actinomycetota bacterium]|nr:MFS transporter [Actinomycetota bacterium]
MTPGAKRWTLVAVILGSGIVFLDTSVVNLALERIGLELPSRILRLGRFEAQNYVAYGYFITLSALLILGGALTDFLGRRKIFAFGLASFLVTSLLCGIAPNIELLILFRILQGAAGAFVVPGSLAIITASFEGEEQGRAFGIWAGASAFTSIIGPTIGGILVDAVSWRVAFLINVPLLVVAIIACLRAVPESRDEDASRRLDWLGSIVIVIAVGGLAFGTIRGEETSWQEPLSLVVLAAGGIAAVAFPFLMRYRKDPLVPLDLFRSRNFAVTNLGTFVIYAALYVTLTYQALFLIGTLGYSPPAAALAGIPGALFLAFFSTRFGKLAARNGPRRYMTIGPLVMALGLAWLVRVPSTSEGWVVGTGPGRSLMPPADYFVDFFPYLILFGIGLMIMVAPLTTALMTSVPKKNSGLASAINNAISRVGSPLIGALIFVAASSSFYTTIADRVPNADTESLSFRREVAPLNVPPEAAPEVRAAAKEASTDAFRLAMSVAGGLMLLGAAVHGFGVRNPRRRAGDGSSPGPPPETVSPRSDP